MFANNRFCIYIGHDQYAATHLCIYKDCKLQQRWCCVQCITSGVHNHGQQGFNHLIPWKDVMVQKKEELLKLQQDHQKGIQQCLQLHKFIKEYQSFIEQQIEKIQKINEGLKHLIFCLSEQQFIKLNNNRLDEVIFMNQSQLLNDQVLLTKSYSNIDQKLKSIIKEFKDNEMSFQQTIDLKKVRYNIKQIDSCYARASVISNNQQYLAYVTGSRLKIYDIQKDNIIREINLDYLIYAIQFTFDSSQLYVGCNEGYVFGFDVLNDFKQMFKLEIHQKLVFNLITIQNKYLITCSEDKTIIKTDTASQQQLFKFGPSNSILAIDYNEIDDILISGQSDKSIKLWDCKSKSILINQDQSHPINIKQIQLINNFQNVLSLDIDNNLYKWRIDLSQKLLIKTQEFQDPNNIYYFYQINQNQNLIVICREYIKILNDQAEIINQIDHLAGKFNLFERGGLDKLMMENSFKQYLLRKSYWPLPRIDQHQRDI